MPHTSSQTFLRELDKKLWTAADKLRSNLDAAVYKHAVLGLIFLKYVSDSFAQRQGDIEAMLKDPDSDYFIDPKGYGNAFSPEYAEAIHQELEERDYYIEKNVFWVPALARWKTLQDSAKLPAGTVITVKNGKTTEYKITSTGKLIDDALEAVEKENPKLKNVPVASVCDRRTLNYRIARRKPHDFEPNRRRLKPRKTSDGRRPTLELQIDPANLAGLIDLIATIPFHCSVAVSASYETSTVADRRLTAENILGHDQESTASDSSSASLGDLCAFAVKNSSSMAIHGIDFGNSFEDSAVGDISSGWTVERTGHVINCVGGGTPSTKEPRFWDDGVHHWTTPKDFSSLLSPILIEISRKLTNAGIAKISSGLLPAGTLLLSSRAPVGYLAISAIPVAINQGFIAMKCNDRASNYFMLNWCQSNMGEIKSRATGTTFPEISKNSFRPISVVMPPKKLMNEFTARVAPLYVQITENLHQSATLASIRETLLPKLLSGEIQICK